MLVVTPWIADTKEQAMAEVRNGHDEFWKFLGPYGWSRGYMGDDGKPSPAGLIPTLEESIEPTRPGSSAPPTMSSKASSSTRTIWAGSTT